MKILVIGSSGQLAQSLDARVQPDLEIIRSGRPTFDIAATGDVRRLLDTHRPDLVVNTAAYTAVDKAESEPGEAMRVNAVGAGVLATQCSVAGVPLVHVSTDYVYDGTNPRPYVETDVPRPLNIYGRSKLAGEVAVAEAAGRHVILRTSWIFSPYGTNFLKTMLRLAQSHDDISVVNDQIGAPTYAPDVADAILAIAPRLIASTDPALFGTYHLTAHGETAWSGFATEIFRLQAERGARVPRVTPIPSSAYQAAARRPANSRLDCSKFDRVFGLRLPHWQDGAARCLARLSSAAA